MRGVSQDLILTGSGTFLYRMDEALILAGASFRAAWKHPVPGRSVRIPKDPWLPASREGCPSYVRRHRTDRWSVRRDRAGRSGWDRPGG